MSKIDRQCWIRWTCLSSPAYQAKKQRTNSQPVGGRELDSHQLGAGVSPNIVDKPSQLLPPSSPACPPFSRSADNVYRQRSRADSRGECGDARSHMIETLTLSRPVLQADAIFDDLLADLILSCTISAHREIKRGRAICGVCGTRRVWCLIRPPSFGQLSSGREDNTYTHQMSVAC